MVDMICTSGKGRGKEECRTWRATHRMIDYLVA